MAGLCGRPRVGVPAGEPRARSRVPGPEWGPRVARRCTREQSGRPGGGVPGHAAGTGAVHLPGSEQVHGHRRVERRRRAGQAQTTPLGHGAGPPAPRRPGAAAEPRTRGGGGGRRVGRARGGRRRGHMAAGQLGLPGGRRTGPQAATKLLPPRPAPPRARPPARPRRASPGLRPRRHRPLAEQERSQHLRPNYRPRSSRRK